MTRSPLLADVFEQLEKRKDTMTPEQTLQALREAQSAGGKKAHAGLTPAERTERGKRAAAARWRNDEAAYEQIGTRRMNGTDWPDYLVAKREGGKWIVRRLCNGIDQMQPSTCRSRTEAIRTHAALVAMARNWSSLDWEPTI